MNSNRSLPIQPRSDLSPRHGFAESHSENMLRDSVLIASALTGMAVALLLQDETGTWYRDSDGLSGQQLAVLELALAQGPSDDMGVRRLQEELHLIENLHLVDDCQRIIGSLCVVSATPLPLLDHQQAALRLLAEHIQTIVTMDHQKVESRTTPRPPAAASFVPGLVHELGSFIFGISANLDAFEARFAEMKEVTKYGANIRKSLDRMGDFIVELREYGYPQRLSWTVVQLEPLLREAVEHCHDAATRGGIDLQLRIEGSLPAIHADQQGLQGAFTRVIGLVLQQEETGGRVLLNVVPNQPGNKGLIHGYLEFSSKKFKDVDPVRLFEPFYFRVSGLGRLTLPGARRVFETHGGTLTAGSGPEGTMRISFMLPSDLTYPVRSGDQP